MPHITPDTPRVARKFLDMPFQAPMPFGPGHALSENEAKWLNSALASQIGNAYSGDVRRAVTALDAARAEAHKAGTYTGPTVEKEGKNGKITVVPAPATIDDLSWDHQARYDAKFHDYELGVSNRGAGDGTKSNDPVEAMISFLATQELKSRIAAKGLKVAAFYKAKGADGKTSKFDELRAKLIAEKGEDYRATAEANIAAMSEASASDDLLEGIEV